MTVHGDQKKRDFDRSTEDFKRLPERKGKGDDWYQYEHSGILEAPPRPETIAMIAATLSKGKKPENRIEDAIELYYRATSVLDHAGHDKISEHIATEERMQENYRELYIIENLVLFERSKDWDEARQYLADHGYPYPVKKAKTFSKHLNKLLNRFSLEDPDMMDVFRGYNADMNKDSRYIPKKWLDVLIKDTKAKRSAGTVAAHRTRRRNQASKTDK